MIPESEHSRWYKGQRYELLGWAPYIRLDGSDTWLATWMSVCPVCGRGFLTTTSASPSRFQPNRRCREHHQPGHPVRWRAKTEEEGR
ncbi:hypothetical protein [Sinorhizobium meliloti]|uniref:hypothetical protein n=1 Tax=Rhizobium meliloti TaxID=382 RepID=UPI00299E99B5|nr:hypothetical protein [Sinorhizobium meliloti]